MNKSISRGILATARGMNGNQKIVLEAISKLILEDDKCHEEFIYKIEAKTGLKSKEICKIFKEFRKNPEFKKIIDINTVAESISEDI